MARPGCSIELITRERERERERWSVTRERASAMYWVLVVAVGSGK